MIVVPHRASLRFFSLATAILWWSPALAEQLHPDLHHAAHKQVPLLRAVDLSVGESETVQLHDGTMTQVQLLRVQEDRDSLSGAVRRAEVTVRIDGEETTLIAANYHLPITVGNVQIDCAVTRGYNSNGRAASWALEKDARLRLWPAGSPWIRADSFRYPAEQRWFASLTQMANEPTYVDGGDSPARQQIYYHSGLDIGGSEGQVDVVAATTGLVVSSAGEVLEGHRDDTPVSPRGDVVYVQDARGWYYRYSHLKHIDPQIKIGRVISMGDAIGVLGKEGASGGWSHLHFEIKARQPSGKWGTQAGYAFLWQAYLQQYDPDLIAVARPHHFIAAGEAVTLDASRSWTKSGHPPNFSWTFHDGFHSDKPQVRRAYPRSGSYSEILRADDGSGNVAYDFAVVQVIDPEHPAKLPPTIHPTYSPTFGLKVGDPVRFTVRSFRAKAGQETWDFGDGTPPVQVQSDGNRSPHAADGYAVTEHRFDKPGDYVVTVQRTNEHGLTATGHLHVAIAP
ncbi:peptidoglycan DD-metalloendopeptidase family protein [Roseiconus nitratireducens]|uniref:Peptidoglycan DD-metalloendopeptidase family protein n=1 Tax=Roseiconus nitratireducens TaxID=2605748 RepID=A0A5M6D8L7_9BACT|nr:PKD domain-containing protein [Roseiconus nitratireducens]KAA5542249.1 peptidoglycan DD-metalloendopeptidase family protein [Roseiconus nitratireducens]